MIAALLPIEREALSGAWPMMRERIAATAARNGEPWTVHEVLVELASGRALLYAAADYATFAIVCVTRGFGGRELHIWIASNDAGERVVEFWPQMAEIARSHGCNRVTWESPRRWDRIVPGTKTRYLYTVEI